jgi:hypothetical protein
MVLSFVLRRFHIPATEASEEDWVLAQQGILAAICPLAYTIPVGEGIYV